MLYLRHDPALLSLIGKRMTLPENYTDAIKHMMQENSKEFESLDIVELFEDYDLTDEDLDIVYDLIQTARVKIEFI